eukprot:scaffold37128_cov65-Phaeocystis_antarctica.AAC.5
MSSAVVICSGPAISTPPPISGRTAWLPRGRMSSGCLLRLCTYSEEEHAYALSQPGAGHCSLRGGCGASCSYPRARACACSAWACCGASTADITGGATPSSSRLEAGDAGDGGGEGRGHRPLVGGGLRLVVGRRRREARRDGGDGERGGGQGAIRRSQREAARRTAVWATQPAAQQLGVLVALVLAEAAGAAVRLGAARGGAEEAPLQLRPPVLPDGRRALPLGLRRREVVGRVLVAPEEVAQHLLVGRGQLSEPDQARHCGGLRRGCGHA